jgi:malonyl-CoA/methylmalonyl-CoA synthetase
VLADFWKWDENDNILNVLPLHHLHGIINILDCALWSGALCEMHSKFSSKEVWKAFLRDENVLTLFMAVPTIYYNLISYYENDLFEV